MSAYYACFDRNLTAIGCLSLSLPVPLRELEPDKSAVLSPCVPPCPPVSLKENDYEQIRSQVRVLPSAPLKAPQIAGFYSFSNRSWLGRTTYLTTYGLLNALFRDQSGWSLCPSAFRRSDPSPLPECVGVRGRRVS